MMSSWCLELKNISIKRGAEVVLNDVSFSLFAQQITGLTGPNGAGKTSLFEAVLGSLPLSSGSLEWSSPLSISFLAQQILPRKVLPLSVRDFVEMGTWVASRTLKSVFSVDEILRFLGLDSISTKLISEISGGQWRRALLARALVQPADLYLLDEPFNQLDMETENRLGHLLQELARKHQKTFFIISHDWAAMDHYFDRLLFLNRRVMADGKVREVADLCMNWSRPEHHKWMHP